MEKKNLNPAEFTPTPEVSDNDLNSVEGKQVKKKNRKKTNRLKSKKPSILVSGQKFETNALTIKQLDTLGEVEPRDVAKASLKLHLPEDTQDTTRLSFNREDVIEAAIGSEKYLIQTEDRLASKPSVDSSEVVNKAHEETIINYVPNGTGVVDEVKVSQSISSKSNNKSAENNISEPLRWLRDLFPFEARSYQATQSGNLHAQPEYQSKRREYKAETKTELPVETMISRLVSLWRESIISEEQLVPTQKKLKQEIESLHVNIMEKEAEVNKLVRERANSLQPEKHETAKVPAGQLPDRLGFMTLKATETVPGEHTKSKQATPELVVNLRQVLEISEKINIGETNLRKVYETKLISDRGLRRAVNVYNKGGDVRRVLAEELLIKEIGFELDPQLRDRPLKSKKDTDEKTKTQVLQSGALTMAKENAQLEKKLETTPTPMTRQAIKHSSRPVLVKANILASIILLILVLVLLITRK